MSRLCIFSSKAVSLMNVARDIAYIAGKRGYTPRVFSYFQPPSDVKRMCDYAVYVMTMSPLWASGWILNAMEVYRKPPKIPTLFYGTIEGKPKKHDVHEWMLDAVPYIANSMYTKHKLEEAGFVVTDIIYHGIVKETIDMAKSLSGRLKNRIRSMLGEGVVFGAVESDHPRKGLQTLLSAFQKARMQDPDIKLYLLTNARIPPMEGLYVDNNYGGYTREETLALIGSFDYLIIPSFAEGFGLPLIEANALGVPVIHCDYMPLSEITCDSNITFPYIEVSEVDLAEGIWYEFHYYKQDDLVKAILEAARIKKENPKEYGRLRGAVRRHALKFDAEKLYGSLLDWLNVV